MAENLPIVGAVYQHFKTRGHYTVIGIALSATNADEGTRLVIYRGQFETLFARKLEEWCQEVAPGIPRFTLISRPPSSLKE